jgi:molybdenum cofactor guanylyltransferase
MSISAVLLAGGKSRRMGEDKATVRFRNAPLWQIQLELLRKLEPQEMFISAQTDPPWRPAEVKFVPDAQPSRGPLSGIAASLPQITTGHLLVLAIDMPFMTEGYLREFCQRLEPGRGVVPIIGNRAEPVAAIYPREAYGDVSAALSGSDFSLQLLLGKLVAAGKLQAIQVSEEEKAFFRNLNEPGDLNRG